MNEAIIVLVFGMRGCGKTVKVRNLIKDCERLLIVDTLGHDYNDGVVFDDIEKLKAFWKKCYRGKFRLIYRPCGGDDELKEDIAQLCILVEALGKNSVNPITFVIEEINIIFDRKRPPTEFNKLVFAGRHANVNLIGCAQRPYGFGRNLSSQAKEFYVFYNREPDDIKFFRENIGREAAEAITQLEKYHYVKWVYDEGTNNWGVYKDEL